MRLFEDASVQEDVFRAAKLCAPCLDRLGELTFSGPVAGVDSWRDAVFARHLFPAAINAHAAVRVGGARELAAIDLVLDEMLAGPPARRSRDAGRMLTADFTPPAGERTLARYVKAVACGAASGHFVTIFSARAAIFHIAPDTAVAALLLLEMRALPISEVWQAVALAMNNLPEFPRLLRAA